MESIIIQTIHSALNTRKESEGEYAEKEISKISMISRQYPANDCYYLSKRDIKKITNFPFGWQL